MLEVLWTTRIVPMIGRWEITDEQWCLLEPVLRPVRRSDGRGRPWQETRAVLNGVLWVLATGAQWRELPAKYPPYQTCHRRFQQWVRSGRLEEALRRLAAHLHHLGKLNLEQAFVDANFASAKKGALPSAPPSAARARSGWYWSTVKVFRWEFGWKVPLREKLVLRKPLSLKSASRAAKAVRDRSRKG